MNKVQAAIQQDLVKQGVKCVLCKVCRVYCTRKAVYVVQGLQCVLYRVCKVNFTSKTNVNQEDLNVTSELI